MHRVVICALIVCASCIGNDFKNSCLRAFGVWEKFRVPASKLEELEKFARLSVAGLGDGNPYEVRGAVHSLAVHSFWKEASRAPQFVSVLERLLNAVEVGEGARSPYDNDVKDAFDRYLGFQMHMEFEDPLFDRYYACKAIGFATRYFQSRKHWAYAQHFGKEASLFRCADELLPSSRELNGEFLTPGDLNP